MSNRNFDGSSIIKILKAQNAANFYNRQLQVVANINTVPAQVEIQPANPQTENYDAEIISTIRAGQQAYYFKNYPIVTSLDPQQYAPTMDTTGDGGGGPSPPTLVSVVPDDSELTVFFSPGSGTVTNYLYSIDGGATFTAFSPAQTTNPVVITGLTNGQTYDVVLKAVTADGTSIASNTISGTPTVDLIAETLTTSLAAYDAALSGTWVAITVAEYLALPSNIASTQKAGANDALLQDASAINFTNSTLLTANMVTTTSPDQTTAIPANSYVYAFAVQYWGVASNSNMAVFTNGSTSTTNPTGFTQLGGPLPPTFANGSAQSYINYYVLKSPSTTNGPTEGLLGVFTGIPTVNGRPSTYYLPYAPAPLISPGVYPIYYRAYGNSPLIPPPPSSSDILSQGTLIAVGIQALTTPTIQWPIVSPATNFTRVSFTTVTTTTWTAPALTTWVNYLVVGGGGGGGNGYDTGGGGGGGAGMVSIGIYAVTPGTTYTITVGAGGAGGAALRTNLPGISGDSSVFDTIVALGGGRGGGSRDGRDGVGGAAQSGTVSAGIGGNGGGNLSIAVGGCGGGGGGASGAGGNGTGAPNAPVSGGAGGSGTATTISGSSVTYGTGGAGAKGNTAVTGAAGAANTGNGGGAGSAGSNAAGAGGNGGSGIVIITFYQ